MMSQPTCRTCYAKSLSEAERERFFAEPMTGTAYHCPEHQAVVDDLMSQFDWSKVQVRTPSGVADGGDA